MPLEIVPTGPPRTFRLAGELDLLNADEVAGTLERESREQGNIVLDLADLAFIDSSGIRVLLRTAENLAGRGRLILRSPSRQVQVVLSLVGVAKEGSGILMENAREPAWGTAVTKTFPAQGDALGHIREFIRNRATEDSFGEWADEIALAVSEASANALVHSGAPEFQVVWRPYADHAEVEVRDGGVFKRALPPQLEGGGNRGFLLMMSLMDQISITCGTDTRPGTVVRMVKNRNGRGGGFRGSGSSAVGTGLFHSRQSRVAFSP